jgi:fructose-1,6-bisphosphatase
LSRSQDQSGTSSVLQPGRELLAAGLALIGVKTRLVLAGVGGANQYLLDKGVGEFIVDKPLTVPPLLGSGDQLILSTGTPDCIEDPFDSLVDRLKVENIVRYHHTGLAALDCYEVMVGGGFWIGQDGWGCCTMGCL